MLMGILTRADLYEHRHLILTRADLYCGAGRRRPGRRAVPDEPQAVAVGPGPRPLYTLQAIAGEPLPLRHPLALPRQLHQPPVPGVLDLSLSSNAFTGPFPPELSSLLNLAVLNLFANRLSGTIPPQLALCAYLNVIDLHANALSGFIPASPSLALHQVTNPVTVKH